ncbi:Uridine-cytidine kinase 2 [Gaertneriomyces sp. JEL0708]|nr:Uridine-cytidine kinase 2 [Gaertneriomyces sp. JEL0708]
MSDVSDDSLSGHVARLETSFSASSLNEPPLALRPGPKPFVIGVAGGGSSGKKTVCKMIMERLLERDESAGVKVLFIKMEDFYKDLDDDAKQLADVGAYNFDHPSAVDFRLLETCLEDILNGHSASIPQYDFSSHTRLPDSHIAERPDVVIFSGIYMLYKKRIRDALDLKVFVDVDSDTRLARQVIRDTEVRYRKPLEGVLEYYLNYVKPSFEDFILPSKKFADVIIPRGQENEVAIGLLAEHIGELLEERSKDPETLVAVTGSSGSISSTTGRRASDASVAKSPLKAIARRATRETLVLDEERGQFGSLPH